MKASHLACKGCGATYPLEALFACDRCFGPLEVGWDESEPVRARARRGRARGRSGGSPTSCRWRRPSSGLPVGCSPLIKADRLAAELGLECDLYIKTETSNPTHSFKDRVVAVAAAKAVELGYEALACASTGNLAGATAAAGAALGLPTYIFVPSDLEREKIIAAAAYGATVFAVDGSYDDVNRLCSELTYDRPWAFVNVNMRAYYAEGSKTIALETAEQLGWRAPDRVVAPIASGSLYTKILQGFEQGRSGRPDRARPGAGDARRPGRGLRAGRDGVRRGRRGGRARAPDRHRQVARDRQPGRRRVRARRRPAHRRQHRGRVSDAEIVEGMRLLARTTGIFTETAGGVTTAVLRGLAERGEIGAGETVVAFITGDGLKTVEAVAGCGRDDRDPGRPRRGRRRAGSAGRAVTLRVRPPRPDDAAAVVALRNAFDRALTGEPGWSEADVRDTWGDLVDVTRDAWLVERDGDLAGYAALHGAGGGPLVADGCVHPDHAGHGVGGRLIDLTESRRRRLRGGGRRAGWCCETPCSTSTRPPGRCSSRAATARRRRHLAMRIDLGAPPPAPAWPGGVAAAAVSARRRRAGVDACVEEAFSHAWSNQAAVEGAEGRRPPLRSGAFGSLRARRRRVRRRPVHDGEHGVGYVNALAVRAPWRRRGLGAALLPGAIGRVLGSGPAPDRAGRRLGQRRRAAAVRAGRDARRPAADVYEREVRA